MTPPAPHDRLCDEARDVLGADVLDGVNHFLDEEVEELLDRHAVGPPVGIGRGEEVNQFVRRIPALAVGRCRQGDGKMRRAVVGADPREDEPPRRLALAVEVVVDDAYGAVVGDRTGVGEIDGDYIRWCPINC